MRWVCVIRAKENKTMASRNDNYWKPHVRKYNRAAGLLNHRFSEVAQACADAVGYPNHVLEIAAGTGLITQSVVHQATRYTVTDATPEMLEVLHQRFGDNANAVVQRADALNLDYPKSRKNEWVWRGEGPGPTSSPPTAPPTRVPLRPGRLARPARRPAATTCPNFPFNNFLITTKSGI
jgi:hypothetical protein